MNIPEKLGRIRQLAEREGVECPRCRGLGGFNHIRLMLGSDFIKCSDCGGTGKVPAYAALLEVVSWQVYHHSSKFEGYVTEPRSWEGMPKGALAGALLHWIQRLHFGQSLRGGEGGVNSLWSWQLGTTIFERISAEDDPDLAACDAVIRAMETK